MAWSVIGEINGTDPAKELGALQVQTTHGEEPTDLENEQIVVAKQLVVDAITRSNLTGPFRVNYGGNRPADWHGVDRGYIAISVAQHPAILPTPEG